MYKFYETLRQRGYLDLSIFLKLQFFFSFQTLGSFGGLRTLGLLSDISFVHFRKSIGTYYSLTHTYRCSIVAYIVFCKKSIDNIHINVSLRYDHDAPVHWQLWTRVKTLKLGVDQLRQGLHSSSRSRTETRARQPGPVPVSS